MALFAITVILALIAIAPLLMPKQTQPVSIPQSGYVSITNTSFTVIAILAMIPTAYYLWKRFEASPRLCVGCGRSLADLPENARVCPYCGKNLDETNKVRTSEHVDVKDSDLIKLAKKYAGIVTKAVVVDELGISLENAQRLLDRFCQHDDEVRRVSVGSYTVYDFRAVRGQLTGLQNEVIELLLQNETISRVQLIQKTKVSIDALEDVVTDLERRGLVSRNPANDSISLYFRKREG